MLNLPPKRRSPLSPPAVQIQICERRLVLSAQMLFDVLGDQALQMHGGNDHLLAIDHNFSAAPIETQASAAHNLSGWTQMQQQFGLTGKGQTVAVIDSGIAWDHAALGKGLGAGYRVVGGWDFTEENDANPYDDGPSGYHGTHVAGIIGSDDPARPGVAPDVDLVALRVFNDSGQGQLTWVEKALQWVHTNRNSFENPITTVNLSIGSTWNSSNLPDWAILEEELRVLHDDGILVTASAGNSFKSYSAPGLSYPATSSYVLPVASVDDNGQLSDFSQRSDRVLAAPGRNILSTVPDHLLGRDGKVDDFSTATGTSMAAPYVAGASVLVRQAMEIAGWNNITVDSIAEHLRNTADSVFDSITKASYDRLDLQQAIDAIIPDDNVGANTSSAIGLDLSAGKLDGWINSLQDEDMYRFTASAAGKLQLDADSDWLDSFSWTISSGGQRIDSSGLAGRTISLVAGQSYELLLSADDEIGTYKLGWTFQADASGESSGGSASPTSLGQVDYWQSQVKAGQSFRAQATADGTFSVLWQNPDSPSGRLSLNSAEGANLTDSTWENGSLRLDVQAKAGQWFDIRLPGLSGDQGDLSIANLLSQSGKELRIDGTDGQDLFAINLQNGVAVSIGEIDYRFAAGQIDRIEMDTGGNGDTLRVDGSAQSEKVFLHPGLMTVESGQVSMRVVHAETVTFDGKGGADSVYLYDSDGDDTLTLRPFNAEMVGAGYNYNVADVDRIFIHATAGGQDLAYVYDSAGEDRLSVRPQFSSIAGAGYYNYISGVERLYAYATAGGRDIADLYDSSGNDRFATTGESASITGPGFASYTKFFDQVHAHSAAGGNDIAALYGSSQSTQWQRGADFISFNEHAWNREARGFDVVETFVGGQSLNLSTNGLPVGNSSLVSPAVFSLESAGGADTANPTEAATACRAIEAPAAPWLDGFSRLNHDSDSADSFSNDFVSTQAAILKSGPEAVAVDQPEPDFQLLADVADMRNWVVDRLELPEEPLLSNPALERELLDEIFRLHDQESLF